MRLLKKISMIFALFLAVSLTFLAFLLSYNADCEAGPDVSAQSNTMQAVVSRCYGSADVLTLEELELPTVANKDVLVKVKAAAVNPLDWHYMRGSPYLMRLVSGVGKPNDLRVGVDFSGVVHAVGDEVTEFKPGDRVFGGRSGAFAEYVLIPEDRALVHQPDDVSFVQAAAVPIAAITALQAVRDKGAVSSGQRVLINGASGGVGTYAVQIAKSLGAEVTGVCSTRNIELVQSVGADKVIDYKTTDYTQEEAVYDVIIDMVGNHSISANRKKLTETGKLILVGGPKGNWIAPFMGSLKMALVNPFVDQELVSLLAEMDKQDMQALAELMAQGKLISVIDRSFSLDQVPDAIRYSETGRARGKIIIDLQQL